MDHLQQEETDSLSSLEERILKAVELLGRLRDEKESLLQELEGVTAEKEAAVRDAVEARAEASRISDELESLRSERKQVRTRIEKLLGQMDVLSAS